MKRVSRMLRRLSIRSKLTLIMLTTSAALVRRNAYYNLVKLGVAVTRHKPRPRTVAPQAEEAARARR